MSTHNIQFHDKVRESPYLTICFLELSEEFRCFELSEEFCRVSKMRSIQCKRASGARVIEVLLYNERNMNGQ